MKRIMLGYAVLGIGVVSLSIGISYHAPSVQMGGLVADSAALCLFVSYLTHPR